MGVRNLGELGPNLQKIIKRLLANKDLVKLLYYTDKDPFNNPELTEKEVKEKVYEKLIKIVPRVGPKETANSIIAMSIRGGTQNEANGEFKDIKIAFEVFTPLTQWIIKDENLRPFAIMGQIQESLNGKTVNGLGKIRGGDFELNFLTEEISCYLQEFSITTYE